ncbi:MAG: transposase, partial [Terracidiphilus sp.]
AILWILKTGAAGRFLRDEFPSPSTCRRRLQQWQERGVWLHAWRTLLGTLAERGYDSGPLRERLKKRGIELIAPYRNNNQQRRYEDGRKRAATGADGM